MGLAHIFTTEEPPGPSLSASLAPSTCNPQSPTMGSAYMYAPLKYAHDIRIMVLQPAVDPSDPLRISFRQGSIDDFEAKYEAISYCWGRNTRDHPLLVGDDAAVFVTRNLDRDLRRFRHKADDRWLWADAACINQSNAQEKAMQIPLMVDIFHCAVRVLAWLGEPTGNTDDSDDESENVANAIRRMNNVSRGPSHGSTGSWKGIKRIKQPLASANAISLLLLNVPWFSRLWIIQEVVLNTDVMLFYGPEEISWLRFCIQVSKIANTFDDERKSRIPRHDVEGREAHDATKRKVKALQKIYELWAKHCWVSQSLPIPYEKTTDDHNDTLPPVINLMTEFATYGCSDERDRIYAMYSMASDIETSDEEIAQRNERGPLKTMISFDITYTKNVLETFRDFALSAIKAGHLSAVLHNASARQPLPEGWPSWVPHWSLPKRVSPLPYSLSHDAFNVEPLECPQDVVNSHAVRLSPRAAPQPSDPGIRRLKVFEKGPNWDETSKDSSSVTRSFVDNWYNSTGIGILAEPLSLHRSLSDWTSWIPRGPRVERCDRFIFILSSADLSFQYMGVGNANPEVDDTVLVDCKNIPGLFPEVRWRSAIILRNVGEERYRLVGDALVVRLGPKSEWVQDPISEWTGSLCLV